MSSSDMLKQVGVILGCTDQDDICSCSQKDCDGDSVIEELDSLKNVKIISRRTQTLVSSSKIGDWDKWYELCKLVFVWNGLADKSNFAWQLLERAKAIEGKGANFILHIKFEGKYIPEDVTKWENPMVYKRDCITEMIRSLDEEHLHIKDLIPVNRIGIGLAWTFCLGYLINHLLGPEGSRPAESYKTLFGNKEIANGYDKLMIVIPLSGRTLETMPGLNTIENVENSRFVGGVQRIYKTTIYEIHDHKMIHHAGVEYATPVRALWKMTEQFIPNHPSIAGLSSYWLVKEIDIFKTQMQQFIEKKELKNEVDLIELDDRQEDKTSTNDKVYIQAIKEKLRTALLNKIKGIEI